jgi:hypothetical protein
MIWTTIPFGKHQGKTLPQIVIDDPDWFFWILPRLYGRLKIEADDLARKASKIKTPRKTLANGSLNFVLHTASDFADSTLCARTALWSRNGRSDCRTWI